MKHWSGFVPGEVCLVAHMLLPSNKLGAWQEKHC